MSLLHFDGFESGTAFYGTGRYVVAGSPLLDITAFTGAESFRSSSGIATNIGKAVTVSGSGIMGFWFRFDAAPSGLCTVARVMEGATTHLSLCLSSGRVLTLCRGDAATSIATGSTLSTGTWYHIDITASIDDASGSVTVLLNDASDITFSGDTRNGGTGIISRFSIGKSATFSVNCLYDDWYMADTSGSGVTAALGMAARVYSSLASAAGSSTAWTPLSGTNVSNVDESNADNDTSYVHTTTAGATDLYTVAPMSVAPTAIHGVMVIAVARKDDAAVRTVRTKMKSGTTTSTGADYATTTSYAQTADMYTTDPDTGLAWTASTVDAIEIGQENV